MYEEETHSAKLVARINKRLAALSRSAITAALNVGLERTYIRDFISGRKKSLGTDKLGLVAKALDWTVAELTDFDTPVKAPKPTMVTIKNNRLPMLDLATEDIPVLGITMGGSLEHDREPDFWINGEVINFVARPMGIKNAANVFALYVSGESMYPRFRERDLVFVQEASPATGDDVVIELNPLRDGDPHPSFIKEFVRRRGSVFIARQFNPAAEIEFSVDEVKRIFRVIPLKELVG